jgi:hypothetical protein
MTDDTTPPQPATPPAAQARPAVAKPAPKKGFDPASIKGGKHPGGKPMRGTKSMLPGKSRGRG